MYDIWLAAEKHIDGGRFENAILLLEGRPNVPVFKQKLDQTQRLKIFFQAGERYFKARNYRAALTEFSKYRSIERDISVAIFESRISTCLQQLDKIQAKKLDDATRVVAGFEWAYKGEKQLSVLDTAAAFKSFSKARQLGGTRNATLREQYQEGLLAIKSLRAWGERYNEAIVSKDSGKIYDQLKEYRSASRYIIGSLESELKKLEEKSTLTPKARMAELANSCLITDLSNYLQTNSEQLPDSEQILRLINEYIQIEKDINAFRQDSGNYEFAKSAYRILIKKGAQVPQIGYLLDVCAKKQYAEFLMELAQLNEKAGDDTKMQTEYQKAIRLLVEAQKLGLSENRTFIDQSISRLASKLKCDELQIQFQKWLEIAQKELANCRVVQAKRAWENALSTLTGCEPNGSENLNQYASLSEKIALLYAADSLYTSMNAQAQKALDDTRCEEAKDLYQKMSDLTVCNITFRDSIHVKNMLRVTACERINCFAIMNRKATESYDQREWKQAYDLYKAAYECGTFAEKEKISGILIDMECKAYPEKCREKGPKISLEPTVRVMANKPKLTEEGTDKPTGYGYFTSTGLQLSFLSNESPVDFVLGVEYFKTEYQSLQTIQGKDYTSSEFDISGASMHVAVKVHQINTDARKIRPYLKGGAELLFPMSYSRVDLENVSNSTTNIGLLKKQSLHVLGSVGIEKQRKKFGYFFEVTLGYNFSGIYNSNAITSGGAKGMTESYFQMAGIRTGIRFW